MAEIYTILLASTLLLLLAFWLLIRLVLKGQEEQATEIKRVHDRIYELNMNLAYLRMNIITSGDPYWLDKMLREESESRL